MENLLIEQGSVQNAAASSMFIARPSVCRKLSIENRSPTMPQVKEGSGERSLCHLSWLATCYSRKQVSLVRFRRVATWQVVQGSTLTHEVRTLRSPTGAQQSPSETIEKLNDRLSPSTLLADRLLRSLLSPRSCAITRERLAPEPYLGSFKSYKTMLILIRTWARLYLRR